MPYQFSLALGGCEDQTLNDLGRHGPIQMGDSPLAWDAIDKGSQCTSEAEGESARSVVSWRIAEVVDHRSENSIGLHNST